MLIRARLCPGSPKLSTFDPWNLVSLRSAGFRAGVTCARQVTITLPVCTPLGPPNGTRFPSRESRPAAPNCPRTLLLRVVLIMPLRALSSKGPTIPPRSPNQPNRPPTDPTWSQPPGLSEFTTVVSVLWLGPEWVGRSGQSTTDPAVVRHIWGKIRAED